VLEEWRADTAGTHCREGPAGDLLWVECGSFSAIARRSALGAFPSRDTHTRTSACRLTAAVRVVTPTLDSCMKENFGCSPTRSAKTQSDRR